MAVASVAGGIGTASPDKEAARVKSRRKGLGLVFWLAFGWIALLTISVVLIDFLPIKPPNVANYSNRYGPISAEYLLGTDQLGRDVFSRILNGAGISLRIAFISPLIGLAIGLTLGVMAGYFRGWVDEIIGILVDVVLAFPNIVAAIAVLFYAGATIPNLILVIAFYTIPQFTRISRANTLLFSQREFVMAARAQGASHFRIITREILPNVLIPVAAYSLLVMSFAIILEGGLSFLGVGLPPPTATWGRMIADGVQQFVKDPRVTFVPAAFMFLTVLSLNLMGDRLRALTDVKASNA